MKNLLFIISQFLFLISFNYCYGFSIDVSCDKRAITINESVRLTISVVNADNPPPSPNFFKNPEGFDVSYGGMQQFHQTQWINGRISSEKRYIYSFELSPKKTGKFTIGPFEIIIGNEKQSSPAIEITISEAPQQADPVIIKTQLNKKSVYPGEPVSLDVIIGYFPEVTIQQGQLSNFQVQGAQVDKISGDNPPEERDVYYGREYIIRRFRYRIIPNIEGEIEIPSITFTYTQAVRVKSRFSDPFFDDFDIFGRTQLVQNTVRTLPFKLKVKNFPAKNKPADFSGATGKFDIKLEINKEILKTNEPATLRIIISGEGNLSSANDIVVPLMPDFKVYPLQLIDKESNINKKVFEVVVIPIAEGEKTIPSFLFSYFDLEKEDYYTKRTEPKKINIIEGEKKDEGLSYIYQPQVKQQVKVLSEDIRYIREPQILKNQKNKLSLLTIIGYMSTSLLFYGLCITYDVRRKRFETDIRFALIVETEENLNEVIKELKRLKPDKRIITKLYNNLTEYISVILFSRKGSFDTYLLEERLHNLGIQDEDILKIKDFIKRLELSSFGTEPINLTKDDILSRLKDIFKILNSLL
ncbi:MAG: BatD family protein [Candidatus Hydrogenedentota bacterium]